MVGEWSPEIQKKKDGASTALLKRKRNGDTLLGYSGQSRQQCDEMPESQNWEVID
jgi:hypothetical protein